MWRLCSSEFCSKICSRRVNERDEAPLVLRYRFKAPRLARPRAAAEGPGAQRAELELAAVAPAQRGRAAALGQEVGELQGRVDLGAAGCVAAEVDVGRRVHDADAQRAVLDPLQRALGVAGQAAGAQQQEREQLREQVLVRVLLFYRKRPEQQQRSERPERRSSSFQIS